LWIGFVLQRAVIFVGPGHQLSVVLNVGPAIYSQTFETFSMGTSNCVGGVTDGRPLQFATKLVPSSLDHYGRLKLSSVGLLWRQNTKRCFFSDTIDNFSLSSLSLYIQLLCFKKHE